jgi:hypothetical protein
LYEFFDQDVKEHREEEVKTQLVGMFAFLEGQIVSYEGYSEGGGQ